MDVRYSHEWEKTVKRIGRWIDFKDDYKTLNLEFMETVWWVFGQIFKKGLVYKGMKARSHLNSCSLPSLMSRCCSGISKYLAIELSWKVDFTLSN